MISLFFLSINLSAQKKQDSLSADPPRYFAFKFSIEGKYDSAIYYYNKELENLSDTSDNYWKYKYKIADCLSKQGKTKKAKQIYLACFKRIEIEKEEKNWKLLSRIGEETKSSVAFTFICLQLADIYIAEKKYDSALYFINWNRLYWPERQMDGVTEKGTKEMKSGYQYALCFNAKKQIDSAINHLAKYAFYTNESINRIFDSAQYKKLVNLYFKLLNKKYRASEIRDSFFYAVTNISFTDKPFTMFYGEDEKNKWHYVVCYLLFFGNKIELMNWNYPAYQLSEIEKKKYSKEYILSDLKNTEIYSLISKLE